MKICILSYKRPHRVLTRKWLPSAAIVVPKSQETDYRTKQGGDIIGIPDEYDGNISRKRNWVLDNIKDKYILMLDDDIKQLGYIEGGEYCEFENEAQILGFLENGFLMCEELGTVLWGLNQQTDRKFYREYSPFSLLSPILGPFHAIVNTGGLRYDEEIPLKEDYDYSLQALHKFHKVLRFNKYHYYSDHISNEGGVVSYRTMKREKDQALLLQKKWGRNVVRLKRKTQAGNPTINPIVSIPLKGI